MKLRTLHKIFIVSLFLGVCTNIWSQKSEANPLMDSLSYVYQKNVYSQPVLAKEAAQKWLEESEKQGLKIHTIRAHYALANLGNISGDYKSAVNETQKTIALLKELNMENGLAASYNILALGYKNLGNYPKAMESFLECLRYAEKMDDTQQEANAYQNIATLYVLQEEYKKATENLDRAADLYRALGDDDGVLVTLFNFASILKEQGKYDEAREHFKTVLEYREKEGNKAVIAYINMNLSQMLVKEEKYDEAVISLKKTLSLLEEVEFTSDMVIILNDLGLCESKLGHTKKAISYFEQALQMGEEQAIKQYKSDIYKNLSQLYQDEGDYKKALAFYEKGVSTLSQQNSLDKEKYVAELQERYETQLKETRINLLEKEQKLGEAELQKAELTAKRQRLIRNVFIAGFILVLLSLLILRHQYVKRLKVQQELSLQREENADQKINQMIKDYRLSAVERYQQGQDEERARLAREIHDGIGSDLAGIKIAFEHYVEDQQEKPQTKRILTAINNACTDVRGLSHQLHPPAFAALGFTNFLGDFIDQISASDTIDFQTFFYPEEDINKLPDALLADVYRVVQELVNNILKHAEATNAEVQLTKHYDHLNIVVNDNGKGFQEHKKQGIGLRNIKERLSKMNGTLDIDSSASSGTSITIDIPLKQTM
ncbi:MAG: sensor histidine kinase [Maribacter dokdonensis]|uniref:tetratricopeptide repeat-containing sensor histidine kinase n=2 Tax=Maribacter dokdonensis TaxID=320912 RepID=UPI0032970437